MLRIRRDRRRSRSPWRLQLGGKSVSVSGFVVAGYVFFFSFPRAGLRIDVRARASPSPASVCIHAWWRVHRFNKAAGPPSTICQCDGAWWSGSCLSGTILSAAAPERLVIETPVYCLTLCSPSQGAAAWLGSNFRFLFFFFGGGGGVSPRVAFCQMDCGRNTFIFLKVDTVVALTSNCLVLCAVPPLQQGAPMRLATNVWRPLSNWKYCNSG